MITVIEFTALIGFVGVLLLFDFRWLGRRLGGDNDTISVKMASLYSIFYVCVACAFGFCVFWAKGRQSGTEFFTGYILVKTNCADNLVVWSAIFATFRLLPRYQHKVLAVAITSVVGVSMIIIPTGVSAVSLFQPIMFVFAGMLFVAGYKIYFLADGDDEEYTKGRIVSWFERHMPVNTDVEHGGRLTTRVNDKLVFTMIAVVVIAIVAADGLFSFDSWSSLWVTTRDPFIAASANACAVLGLRPMFFLLEAFREKLSHLKKALGLLVIFIATKMTARALEYMFLSVHWRSAARVAGKCDLSNMVTLDLTLLVIVGAIAMSRIKAKRSGST